MRAATWSKWVSWSLVLLSLLFTFVAPVVVEGLAGLDLGGTPAQVVSTIGFLLVGPVFGVVGAMIVSRQPRNSIGWMMLIVSIGISLSVLAETVIPATAPASLSAWQAILIAISGLTWMFFIFPVFHLLLTFPNGRVLTPRWRVLVILEVAMVTFLLFIAVFGEVVAPINEEWTVANPIGFVPESIVNETFDVIWNACLLALTVGGVVSVVLRFRRSRGVERQQLKSLVFAVGLFFAVYGGAAALPMLEGSDLLGVLLPFSLLGIGAAVGIAVLRYRLYDLDRLISRTVTYALVVGVLVGSVAAIAAVVGTRFDDPLVVAGTTLGVAAVFNPLRRRVQAVVDRRFNRSHYDAERVMDEFATTLRDEVDEEAVVDGWRGVVVETMSPRAIGVWVRHA